MVWHVKETPRSSYQDCNTHFLGELGPCGGTLKGCGGGDKVQSHVLCRHIQGWDTLSLAFQASVNLQRNHMERFIWFLFYPLHSITWPCRVTLSLYSVLLSSTFFSTLP